MLPNRANDGSRLEYRYVPLEYVTRDSLPQCQMQPSNPARPRRPRASPADVPAAPIFLEHSHASEASVRAIKPTTLPRDKELGSQRAPLASIAP